MKKHPVTLIKGDGTGPELAAVTKTVLDATGVAFDWVEVEAGVDIMEKAGTPLPDNVLTSIRQTKTCIKAPIIMLTGMDGDSDQILGLESGANDYVAKPVRFAVLLARIRAHLRNFEQSEDATFTIGPYTFKPASKLLVGSNNQKVRLTEKETSILKFLYRAGDKPVGRDVLLHEVWGYNPAVTTHTLETHIYRLRQKIEKDPARAQLLITEGGGYRLVP